MNKNNNFQNDQITEEQQPSDETQTEYREISDDELKQILEDHKKWLKSDGEMITINLKNNLKIGEGIGDR